MRKGESYGETQRPEREASGKKTVAMTLLAILAFLVLICTMLLLLYYFYYPMGTYRSHDPLIESHDPLIESHDPLIESHDPSYCLSQCTL